MRSSQPSGKPEKVTVWLKFRAKIQNFSAPDETGLLHQDTSVKTGKEDNFSILFNRSPYHKSRNQ